VTGTNETSSANGTLVADAPATSTRRRRGTGLTAMLLPELQQLAGSMGITGVGRMRKGQLVEAITAARGDGAAAAQPKSGKADPSADSGDGSARTRSRRAAAKSTGDPAPQSAEPTRTADGTGTRSDGAAPAATEPASRGSQRPVDGSTADASADASRDGASRDGGHRDDGDRGTGSDRNRDTSNRDTSNRDTSNRDTSNRDNSAGNGNNRQSGNRSGQQSRNYDDNSGGGRRGRRRRNRDRNRFDRSRRDRYGDADTTVSEDDVLLPVAGIIDILDNYAFVRTGGYLPGPDDVYVSLSLVRKYGLRKGDAVTGQVRQPREGEQRREKFNPLVRIDTVNGADPDNARGRVEFNKLTPLYPQERLRLETEPTKLIGRLVDIVAPIGKGQRGLIVAPSKAGKTTVMQQIANAITTNNPDVHLMVVLVVVRAEEVTEMQRAVKGEVISSTFDRQADDHTTVAELAIERAKRLVELGHDVVVLLDSITKLGRAYNLAAPASGRILSGGVDSAALYPPKRFFGAARNIEHGGSLTILATALIETGSRMDEVIFEEFKGTGNMELRLRREFADKRIFPAIDVDQSGTRREELLMGKEELAIVWKLRRVLAALDGQQALELMLNRLKKSSTNVEFLMQVQKTTPGADSD